MKLYRALRDTKRTGNFLVRQTAHEQLEHLRLSRSQRMARQELRIKEGSCVVNVYQQDLGRHPKLPLQNVMDCQGQFGLPCSMKFDEAVDSPIEEPSYFVMRFGIRGKKNKELAAWRRSTTAPCKAPQVRAQRTRIKNKKPRAIALANGLCFGQSRRKSANRKILHARKCLLDGARKKRMRTHDLNSDSHSRHAPLREYATCSSQAGRSLWNLSP